MAVYYYYCKMDTFKAMLKSKTLWLTDLTKSNDAEEVARAYENLWNRVKARLETTDLNKEILYSQFDLLASTFTIQSKVDIPYGCCFCSEKDLVQQWREYGENGKGVAVGLDLDCIPELKKQYPITSCLFSDALGYEMVYYDCMKLEEEFVTICYDTIRKYGKRAWLMSILPTFKHYAGFIKNPTFRDEKETRIVYYPNEHFEDQPGGLGPLKTEIVPHYLLPWAAKADSAIRSVTIGYTNQIKNEDINALIEKSGIKEKVIISRSECSYRERIHT